MTTNTNSANQAVSVAGPFPSNASRDACGSVLSAGGFLPVDPAPTTPACEASARVGVFSDVGEALANSTIGFIVSWAATYFILGYTAAGSIAVTAMFFGLSFVRSWALRRLFRRLA